MNGTIRRNGGVIVLVLVASAVMGSCSSSPKQATEVLARKNEAADYSRLADDFFFKGQYTSALQYYAEALDTNLSVDNVDGAIVARNSLGRAMLALGRLDDAEREFGDALADARVFGRPALIALSLSNLGDAMHTRGSMEDADTLFAEAETMAPTNDAVWAVIQHNRGVAAMALGDLAAAQAFLQKAEQANVRAKRWAEAGSNRYVMASIMNAKGRLPDAIAWAEKALAADKTAENSLGIGGDLEALARLRRKAGEPEKSFDL
ncbi:MAG: tetratricopeptide repeat protein, partial [Spirochaetales bacterium]